MMFFLLPAKFYFSFMWENFLEIILQLSFQNRYLLIFVFGKLKQNEHQSCLSLLFFKSCNRFSFFFPIMTSYYKNFFGSHVVEAFTLPYLKLLTQSCPTLCYPMDCSPPGSSVHRILQARILEWVAISFSRGSSRPRDQTQVSHIAGRCFNFWATREAP